MVAIIDNLLV